MNRHAAREKAMQILFQLDINDKNPEQAMTDYLESLEIDPYLQDLVKGAAAHKSAIDNTIITHLENWTIDRIASVERTILRIAVYELDWQDEVPQNVAINEAVELAHKYGDDNSGRFVNGVLSNVIA
ncbi:transcription antitermination factor NusB [Barrientosiimonas marina]|uniref:Transcription antitermination protein NusB n=1 Tax=Lentibacillus kimchii TaxID=1542911 RepID=A0ABW2UXX1_9BACI